jgi:hypothetical protein
VPGVYHREGGHWVTFAGFRESGLVFHDPGPWQKTPHREQIILRRNQLIEEEWSVAPLLLEVPLF